MKQNVSDAEYSTQYIGSETELWRNFNSIQILLSVPRLFSVVVVYQVGSVFRHPHHQWTFTLKNGSSSMGILGSRLY